MMAIRRRYHQEQSDNWFMSQPALMTYKWGITDRQNLYVVRVYRPFVQSGVMYDASILRDSTYNQEIWLLGHHTLADLRDLITCPADNNIVGEQQIDTLKRRMPRAGDVYKSSFIYIDGCFYLDTRHPENVDYSQVIIDWATRSNRGLGPFKKGVMETTKMDDLEFRVGYPYVFTHLGNHEHLVAINDVRLVGPEDPQNENRYPFVRSIGNQQSRMCMVCKINVAKWVTVNNKRVSENPYFFCSLCYKSFNLKVDGTKEGEFDDFRYHDVNSV